MTIEEQITIFEHNAEHERKEGDLHNCLNFRQLAQWLKELKSHREAWGKAKRTVKAYLMLEEFGSAYQDDIENLIDGCRPKEGDSNASAY